MFENTSLDQFSALDDFAYVTPVWRPFVRDAAHQPVESQEAQQQNAECSR